MYICIYMLYMLYICICVLYMLYICYIYAIYAICAIYIYTRCWGETGRYNLPEFILSPKWMCREVTELPVSFTLVSWSLYNVWSTYNRRREPQHHRRILLIGKKKWETEEQSLWITEWRFRAIVKFLNGAYRILLNLSHDFGIKQPINNSASLCHLSAWHRLCLLLTLAFASSSPAVPPLPPSLVSL